MMNPFGGGYRRTTMTHKAKNKYDRKNLKTLYEEECRRGIMNFLNLDPEKILEFPQEVIDYLKQDEPLNNINEEE